MKTTEELNAIREEIAGLTAKLKELSEEELEIVGGGAWKPCIAEGAVAIFADKQQTRSAKEAAAKEIAARTDTFAIVNPSRDEIAYK